MKKSNLLIAAAFAAIVSSAFVSCKHNLIPEPTIDKNASKNPADYADAILPPKEVTATHGGYRNITLEWTPVENAVRYQIFYAKTPFDDFELFVETADTETTYEVEAAAGSTYFFYVKAINFYETVSAESIKVTGSTLAIPIITDITPSEDSQSVEISWWMDNCNPDTYQDNLSFTIKVYDSNNSNKKEIPGTSKCENGNIRSTVISGLAPKTEYFFTVQAEISGTDQKPEISDITSKETAHSIIPSAVSDFYVSQGISHSEIALTWKLPDGADFFDTYTNTYSIHPVLFNIQRKEINQDDSAYKDIAFIGIEDKVSGKDIYSHPYKLTHSFDCTAGTTSDSEKLIINKETASGDIDSNNSYPKYKPGTTLTFLDTKDIVKGKQYTYRIISVTDDTLKVYKADSSVSDESSGWLFGSATFRASANYEENEDKSEFTKVTINFDFNFVPFSSPYSYILTQTIIPFKTNENPNPQPGEEKIITISDNVSSISGKQISLNLKDDENIQKGSYKFALYITDKTVNKIPEEHEYYERIESSGTIAVTDDKNSMPEITFFNVEDGYADKFVLTWNFNEAYSYKLSWTPYDGENALTSEEITLTADDLKIISDGKVTYEHAAISGDSRTYRLTAENGLSVFKDFTDENDNSILCQTLGTAKPEMKAPDYTTITVSWPSVQKADTYSINAKYADNPDVTYDDSAAALDELITNENCSITEENGIITCEIQNISGYDNPAVSGLPIEFTVTASNSLDNTKKSETVFNLGPALTFPKTNDNIQSDRVSFTWNKVEGAEKYLVYRVLYKDREQTEVWGADKYIITETEIINDSDIGDRAKISYNESKKQFTLTDFQKDAADPYGYHMNQAKIQWGLPYGYIVLPLRENDSKDTFAFESDSLKINSESSAVDYGTLSPAVTHTYGYGMNIRAKKSESASAVDIEWTKPNNKELIPTIYRKPFIKDDEPEYGSSWEKVATLSQGATNYSDKLSKDNISSAFVYCVQYEASTASDIVKSYREQLLNTKDSESDEPLNKGYLLTLKNFDAIYGGAGTAPGEAGYYQENVNWSNTWDYEERALGPDSFTIDLKNKNLSCTKNWVTVASISIDSDQDRTQTITANTEYTDSAHAQNPHTDTIIEVMASNNGITLTPKGLSEGNDTPTTGLLQVLRDAKHYYSVNLTRGTITVRQAEDESVYAYRQISDEEFTKAVMVYVTEGLSVIGKLDFESKSFSGSIDGTITGYHRSTMNMGKGYDINMTNYTTTINTPHETPVSLFKITTKMNASRDQLGIGGFIKTIEETSISATPYLESLPSSYYGTITFSLSNEKTVTLKCKSVDISTNSVDSRRRWVPFCIYNDENWYQDNSEYGWWN